MSGCVLQPLRGSSHRRGLGLGWSRGGTRARYRNHWGNGLRLVLCPGSKISCTWPGLRGLQKIGVDAHIKAIINGTAYLIRDSVEIPFTIEKRLGAAAHMGNIRYDKDKRAVVGDVEDPFIDLGDGVILKALSQAGAQLLAQQTERFRATPLIKKDQLQEMVAPAGGPLKLKMGIDDVRIEVNENDLQLKVRFAFEQPQLPGS